MKIKTAQLIETLRTDLPSPKTSTVFKTSIIVRHFFQFAWGLCLPLCRASSSVSFAMLGFTKKEKRSSLIT
jgi:hypothetical protein